VFHVHVGKYVDASRVSAGRVVDAGGSGRGVDSLAQAHRLVGRALQEPLVGDAGTDVDVHPAERRANRGSDGDRGQAVVPEHVHAHRQVAGLSHRAGECRHLGDDVFRHVVGVERSVTEVLDRDGVDAALGESLGV